MVLPSINELMEKVGVSCYSVTYNESRTITKHLDNKVLAYGTGLGGFVAIWKDSKGHPHAHSLFCRNPFGEYNDGAFHEMPVEQGLKIIQDHKGITEREFSDEELNESLKKKKFERPERGSLVLDYGNHYYTFKVSQYKNGKYCVEKWYGDNKNRFRWKRGSDVRDMLHELALAKGERDKDDRWEDIPKIVENSIPEKDMTRINMILVTGEV